MSIWLRLFMSLIILGSFRGHAQNITNKGKDFWVGYGHHQFMESGGDNSQEMVLYFASEQVAHVTVKIEGTTWVRNYTVPANSAIMSDSIPKVAPYDARLITVACGFVFPGQACGGVGRFQNKGIHITSDVPIVAYAHIFGSASSGATMLLPTDAWGYMYYSVNSEQNYAANCYSWMYVIANRDNTVIEITPSVSTRGNPSATDPASRPQTPGVTFRVTLNRGEIYQTMGGPESGSAKGQMTGTKVKSVANSDGNCYPIAVFSGSSRTNNQVPNCGTGGGDNDNQQVFPTTAWGKRYILAPLSNSSGASSRQRNAYKIVLTDPATVVRRNGAPIGIPLTNNRYYFYTDNDSEADYIEADKPVMIAQFMTGGSPCLVGNGDPEMIILSPIEQGIKKINFYRNDKQNIGVTYLTLVIPTAGLTSLRIDGAVPDATFPVITKAGYSVAVKRFNAGKGQSRAVSDSAFTAVTYGLGSVESYGYNAGTNLNNLNAISSIKNVLDTSIASQNAYTCTKTPVKLSVLMAYQPLSLSWSLSSLSAVVTPSADVVQAPAVPVGTVVVDGVTYYKYSLPGDYVFSQDGTYSIPIVASSPTIDNCSSSETLNIDVEVRRNPIANFSWNSMGCALDTLHLKADDLATTLPNTRYFWNFLPAGANRPGQFFDTLIAPACYPIKLSAVTNDGCLSDTTKTVCVSGGPSTSIIANKTTICVGDSISYTSGSGGPGTWYWNFGQGGTVSFANNNPRTIRYDVPGTYQVKHLFNAGGACQTDTARLIITVFAKPRPMFTVPDSCLGPGVGLTFTNTTTLSDTQTVQTWAWNFADPLGGTITSSAQHPTYTYTNGGTYNVVLGATTYNGCFKDTTISIVVNKKPVISFGPQTSVCVNTSGTVSVANATVTNGVTGTGVYRGPGTDAAGNFNAAVAGTGSHTIWYVFTSAAGCKDSASTSITVNSKPAANFNWPGGNCRDTGLITFNNLSTVGGGATISGYAWDFGHPASGGANSSTQIAPTHDFAPGSYNVRLTATASTGCVGDTTIQVIVYVLPKLRYTALTPVCENAVGTVSVANGSNTNSVPGTGEYHSPFADLAGNFNPSAAGAGSHTVWYVYRSTTGSCVDSISQVMVVKPRPHPRFTVPGGGCLANDTVQFTNTSTIIGNLPMTYSWIFGDGSANAGNPNTSTLTNPTHIFQTATYNVQLTATSSNGCVGDTTIPLSFTIKPQLTYGALAPVCVNAPNTVSVALASNTNGVAGTGIYKGPGTSAAGAFMPALAGPGTHTIWYVYSTAGTCIDSVSQTIRVYPKPVPSFTFPNGSCMANGTVTFTNTSTIQDGTPLTFAWDFGHPASGASNNSTQAAPTHTFGDATYQVKLTATSGFGCVADTTGTATFSIQPQLAYGPLTPICENNTGTVSLASGTVTNGITGGTATYSGPGIDAAGNFNPATAGAGVHTITYSYTTASNCTATKTATITVASRPHPNFTLPAGGCLDTGLVQLNNTTPALAGSTITWSWNFGDNAANAGNPNTSSLQSPAHTFGTGPYTITLTANASNGCSGDTAILANFSIKPKIFYAAPAALCASVPGTVSIATGSVTNGVIGTGAYSGTGVDAAGNFNPSQAGAGTHAITFTFTSAAGCAKDTTVQIVVHPKPAALFSVNRNICLDSLATITDASTIASGSITNWNWDLGNGQTPNNLTNASFTAAYLMANPGDSVKTITLTVISDKGCSSDPYKKNLTVHPLPLVNFNLPASVCLPGGAAAFTSTSTAGDNSALTYVWNFGDGPGTTTGGAVSHQYADSNAYSVKLIATSAFGCVHDTTKVLSAFFYKPHADFAVNSLELCQGEENEFTDLSTASGSSIVSRLWNFGNGVTDSAAAPKIVYSGPGLYLVRLQVTNAVGCTADTSKQVKVNLQPVVDAGPSFVVPVGTAVRFNPTVNSSNLQLVWTPAQGLSGANMLRPTITATNNGVYFLTAMGDGGCTATDSLTVKVLLPVRIPNAFSPNGDGIHDTWAVENLKDYPGAMVEVFNRYGQKVYQSSGYAAPWDGRFNGAVLPFATYYYVITLKNGYAPITGSITIVR